jgi:signal transduction histidine kinase/CheY-like chemotaxis protein/AraC-like DNA-binding protein
LLRLREGRLRRITTENGLANDPVLTIHEGASPEDASPEGASGHLWVGTTEEGLTRIDRRGTPALGDDRLTPIGPEDGLPSDLVIHIRADAQGRLWMSSHRGLFWVDRAALNAHAEGDGSRKGDRSRKGDGSRIRPVRYTERDGLASREANGGVHTAGARTSGGRLWFPTQRGIAVVDPSEADPTPPAPIPAAIEGLAPADTTVADATVADTTYRVGAGDTVRLRPEQRTFTAWYTGLHFSRPEATRFRVQLAGFDPSPTRTDQRRVRYTEVDPGTYTLVVQAAGERGAFGEPATLHLVVAPFWWETGWFLGLCGLGLIGLAGGAYRWRTHRLRRRRDELAQTVAERTEQIREKNNQLERQAEKLKELDEAKSRFFANVSHEFRTPLTLIRGPIQELREQVERGSIEIAVPDRASAAVESTAQLTEHLGIVERNTARLQRLVSQLLGLARLEAGTYDLDARPTDLRDAVGRIARSVEPLAERKGLTLDVEAAAGAVEEIRAPVWVDREALEHIVNNLLSNAVKFTPEGGRVTVRVHQRREAVEIAVEDTGVGIPEAEQDAIFNRFAQTDDTSTREQEGAGIGLAFAADLVDLHGGTLTAESTEGEGTTFTARLPRGKAHLADDQLADDAPESPSEPASSRASSSTLDPPRSTPDGLGGTDAPDRSPAPGGDSEFQTPKSKLVLVVDDNADVRRYVRSVLEPAYAVIEAAGGAEGLRRAREALPDVILADVMMPEMDGHEMTRRLKDDPETEASPVIMLTAQASTEDEIEGFRVGADDYVTKPFDADVLRQRVGGVLRLQQRLRRRLEEEIQAEEAPPSQGEVEERPEIEREARRVIREHLTDPDFGVADLASEMAMSRSTLYRKLKTEKDVPPSALITTVRIEKARDLLKRGESVTQVAYAVGYASLTGFTEAFEKERGVTPATYAAAA